MIEAAMLNIPCIQLGDLGTTQLLPNVRQHSDVTTLGDKIETVLSEKVNSQEYEHQLEQYVSAAMDVGFDLNYFGVWYYGETGDQDEIFRRHADELRRCFQLPKKREYLQDSG